MRLEYRCSICGKEIFREEAYEATVKVAKKFDHKAEELDPLIYDIWFIDFCNDCADLFDPNTEKKGVEKSVCNAL